MRLRSSIYGLAIMVFLAGQGLIAGVPGFDDIGYTGAGGQQHQSSIIPIDQLATKYNYQGQGAWQDSPGQYTNYGQNGQYGQWSDQGQFINQGQWNTPGQYSDYGYKPSASQNSYGVQQNTGFGSDALAQMGQQDFYNDENRSWMPTFGEFFRLTPEQRSQYARQINDYRKRLLEDLKIRNRREHEAFKDYHRQLGYRRKDEDKDFSEAKRQISEQLKREEERLSDEYKRQRERLSDEERRVRDYYRDNPLQEINAKEKLRLQKIQLEMQYNLAREQKKDQRLQQEASLEARRMEILKKREQEDQQLKIQQITWEARYRMSVLSLQGPFYRNKITPPRFDTGGRIASEKYHQYYQEMTKAWIDQRKHEEQRIKELQRAKDAIAAVQVKSYRSTSQRGLDSAARQQNMKLKLAALQSARNAKARSYQLKLQREQQKAKWRVEDKQLDLYLKELRASGRRLNSDAVSRYKDQLKRQRSMEEDKFKDQDRDLKDQIKREAEQHKDYARQLDRKIRDAKEQMSRRFRDIDESYRRQKRDKDEQLKIWTRRRREEEKYVTDSYRRWVDDQKRAIADYERAIRR